MCGHPGTCTLLRSIDHTKNPFQAVYHLTLNYPIKKQNTPPNHRTLSMLAKTSFWALNGHWGMLKTNFHCMKVSWSSKVNTRTRCPARFLVVLSGLVVWLEPLVFSQDVNKQLTIYPMIMCRWRKAMGFMVNSMLPSCLKVHLKRPNSNETHRKSYLKTVSDTEKLWMSLSQQ